MNCPRDFDEVLTKIAGAKQSGDGWTAPCPLPGHKTPVGHLSLKDVADKALVKCQGGKHTYQEICEWLGFGSLAYRTYGEAEPPAQRHVVATYDYTDAEGRLLFQTVRFFPKDFRQRRADSARGWAYDLKGVKRVLYRLPEVLKAAGKGETVYVVEGEKDADNVRALGLVATTNPMGAGKWGAECQSSRTLTHLPAISSRSLTHLSHEL